MTPIRYIGNLTAYERRVAWLIVVGHRPKRIAGMLGRNVKSVESATCTIRQKLGAVTNAGIALAFCGIEQCKLPQEEPR